MSLSHEYLVMSRSIEIIFYFITVYVSTVLFTTTNYCNLCGLKRCVHIVLDAIYYVTLGVLNCVVLYS